MRKGSDRAAFFIHGLDVLHEGVADHVDSLEDCAESSGAVEFFLVFDELDDAFCFLHFSLDASQDLLLILLSTDGTAYGLDCRR